VLTTDASSIGTAGRRPRIGRLLAGVGVALVPACAGPSYAGTAAGNPPGATPVGTTSELMADVILPTSDAIFYITTRTPGTAEEWGVLQGQALMLAESANLLTMPGYARDDSQWMSDARLMLDAGRAAYGAVKQRDVATLEALSDPLYESCLTCHEHYREGPLG